MKEWKERRGVENRRWVNDIEDEMEGVEGVGET